MPGNSGEGIGALLIIFAVASVLGHGFNGYEAVTAKNGVSDVNARVDVIQEDVAKLKNDSDTHTRLLLDDLQKLADDMAYIGSTLSTQSKDADAMRKKVNDIGTRVNLFCIKTQPGGDLAVPCSRVATSNPFAPPAK